MKQPLMLGFLLATLLLTPGMFPFPHRILEITAGSSPSASSDSWPTFHHDSGRAGFAAGSAPHNASISWKFKTGGPILSSPVAANGVVYISSTDHHTYALNQSTGGLIWTSENGTGSFYPTPAIDDGGLYVADGYQLVKLNLSTGAVIWRDFIPRNEGLLRSVSVLAVNGRIYTATEGSPFNATLYSFNATDGSVLWNSTLSPDSDLAYADGLIYFNWSDEILALNGTTGSIAWNVSTGHLSTGGPTLANGVLYSGGFGLVLGPFYALNATTGAIIWRTMTTVVGVLASAYGRLYGATPNGMRILNQTDGSLLAGFMFHSFEEASDSLPAVADGVVVIGGGGRGTGGPWFPDPTIYGIDAFTGRLDWAIPVGYAADASPAIAGGVVYVGASDGILYAIGQSPPPPAPDLYSQIAPFLIISAVGMVLLTATYLMLRRRRTRKSAPTAVQQ